MGVTKRMIKFKDSVNILGTEYKVVLGNKTKYPVLEIMDGCADTSIKRLLIDDASFVRDEVDAKQDMDSYIKEVLRHEIIHAFLFESGLEGNTSSVDHWANSEEIVDWFALQSPKIFKAFQEVGCLG